MGRFPISSALLVSCRAEREEPEAGAVPAHPFWAACSVLLTQVRLQTQTTYRGIFDCVVKTYRHESVGVLLLWGFGRGRPLGGRQQLSSPPVGLCP